MSSELRRLYVTWLSPLQELEKCSVFGTSPNCYYLCNKRRAHGLLVPLSDVGEDRECDGDACYRGPITPAFGFCAGQRHGCFPRIGSDCTSSGRTRPPRI